MAESKQNHLIVKKKAYTKSNSRVLKSNYQTRLTRARPGTQPKPSSLNFEFTRRPLNFDRARQEIFAHTPRKLANISSGGEKSIILYILYKTFQMVVDS